MCCKPPPRSCPHKGGRGLPLALTCHRPRFGKTIASPMDKLLKKRGREGRGEGGVALKSPDGPCNACILGFGRRIEGAGGVPRSTRRMQQLRCNECKATRTDFRCFAPLKLIARASWKNYAETKCAWLFFPFVCSGRSSDDARPLSLSPRIAALAHVFEL